MTVALTRGWYLYRILADDGALLYVGKSNDALRRFVEHLKAQQWAGEICDHIRDRRVFATEAEVLAAERAAIESERPRFNVQWNQGNPGRVDPRTMRFVDGRLYRPDLYHRGGVVAPPAVSLRRPAQPRPAARPVSRRARRVRRFAAGWAVVAVLLFAAAVTYTDFRPEQGAAGAGVVALPVVWWLRGRALAVRRRWRRFTR